MRDLCFSFCNPNFSEFIQFVENVMLLCTFYTCHFESIPERGVLNKAGLYEMRRSNKILIRFASRNNNQTRRTTLSEAFGVSNAGNLPSLRVVGYSSFEERKPECRPLLCTRRTRSMRRGLIKQSPISAARLHVIDYSNRVRATSTSRFLRIGFL